MMKDEIILFETKDRSIRKRYQEDNKHEQRYMRPLR